LSQIRKSKSRSQGSPGQTRLSDMTSPPDFFLTSARESPVLEIPLACWIRGRLEDAVRADHLIVDIAPALLGQRFGLGGSELGRVILSEKHVGDSLFPISVWPCPVYVSRSLDDRIFDSDRFEVRQVEMIAWGVITQSRDEALKCAGGESQ